MVFGKSTRYLLDLDDGERLSLVSDHEIAVAALDTGLLGNVAYHLPAEHVGQHLLDYGASVGFAHVDLLAPLAQAAHLADLVPDAFLRLVLVYGH